MHVFLMKFPVLTQIEKNELRIFFDVFAKNFQKTIAVRRVPAVRLEDVLERIPAHISVEFLKTDIQGLDLQALKSAGDQILRVKRIQTEIMNTPLYSSILAYKQPFG